MFTYQNVPKLNVVIQVRFVLLGEFFAELNRLFPGLKQLTILPCHISLAHAYLKTNHKPVSKKGEDCPIAGIPNDIEKTRLLQESDYQTLKEKKNN